MICPPALSAACLERERERKKNQWLAGQLAGRPASNSNSHHACTLLVLTIHSQKLCFSSDQTTSPPQHHRPPPNYPTPFQTPNNLFPRSYTKKLTAAIGTTLKYPMPSPTQKPRKPRSAHTRRAVSAMRRRWPSPTAPPTCMRRRMISSG